MAPRSKGTVAILAASAIALLASIASATDGPLHIPNTEDAKALIDGGYINVDTSNVNDQGAAATLTEKGKTFMDDQSKAGATGGATGAAAGGGEPTKPTFEIFKKAPAVAKRQAGGAANVYPFDDLPAPENGENAAFFVPVSAERPEPWKSLSSTVSSATARYATKTGETAYKDKDGKDKTRATYSYSRKFRISEGERGGVKGAFIERYV